MARWQTPSREFGKLGVFAPSSVDSVPARALVLLLCSVLGVGLRSRKAQLLDADNSGTHYIIQTVVDPMRPNDPGRILGRRHWPNLRFFITCMGIPYARDGRILKDSAANPPPSISGTLSFVILQLGTEITVPTWRRREWRRWFTPRPPFPHNLREGSRLEPSRLPTIVADRDYASFGRETN